MTDAQSTTGNNDHDVDYQMIANQSDALTIREKWLTEFKSRIDLRYYKRKFGFQTLHLLDEYRKEGRNGIYNTSKRILSKKSLTHLNVQARQEDEYDPARMAEIVEAYNGYNRIVSVMNKRYENAYTPHAIFGSIPFFSFVVRDFLTKESDRIIREDPVIAALKFARHPSSIVDKLGGKDTWIGIRYLRKRMAARVTSELAQWCHAVLPAEAERCGLPKEPVRNEFEGGGRFELAGVLEELHWDVIDLDSMDDLAELQGRIADAESLLEDGHVFYFCTKDYARDDCYLLYVTEIGNYYQQHIRDKLLSWDADELIPLEDDEMIAAILDTGISPIIVSESEINE